MKIPNKDFSHRPHPHAANFKVGEYIVLFSGKDPCEILQNSGGGLFVLDHDPKHFAIWIPIYSIYAGQKKSYATGQEAIDEYKLNFTLNGDLLEECDLRDLLEEQFYGEIFGHAGEPRFEAIVTEITTRKADYLAKGRDCYEGGN
jgi:hypothetical protein